ncbi:MAG: TFIIB-type zinc ribbon-containing protein [Lachnospiraceae bacterium]|jgi:DNA-directed RNA polymerase subunit RPC12/RpoP|nr:TFIIB-type zinc ribbon-containing protein [Lachnospiraceae bacterium]
MSDYIKKYKEVMDNLNNSIKDEESLKIAKEQITNLMQACLDEMDSLTEKTTKAVQIILQKQLELEQKVTEIDSTVTMMERDFYDDDNDFEIICPYCNHEFFVDLDEGRTEVVCPECNNSIELNWNEAGKSNDDCECGCGCSHSSCSCDDSCCNHDIDNDNDYEEDDEDDM